LFEDFAVDIKHFFSYLKKSKFETESRIYSSLPNRIADPSKRAGIDKTE
jgi:hypothetical protein